MSKGEFPQDPSIKKEQEAANKKELFNQECLFELNMTEIGWLKYLYDTQPWVAENLQIIRDTPGEKENFVQEGLRGRLEIILEQQIDDFIKIEFAEDPVTIRHLQEFAETPEGWGQLAKACLVYRTNPALFNYHERAELFVKLREHLEKIKALEPFALEIMFTNIVENLLSDRQFGILDDMVSFLNKLCNQMGEKAAKDIFAKILKKHSKDSKKKNMLLRLKRALGIGTN